MTTRKDGGFSIVEVMIAIAIIGILATIAIPNYQKRVSISRQAQAKAALTGLVAAEKAFFIQYGNVTSRLDEVGWHPSGMQNYKFGFTKDYPAAGAIPNPPFSATDTVCYDTYTNDTSCIAGFTAKWQNAPGVASSLAFSTGSFPGGGAPWLGFARGNLGNPTDDEWTIDSHDNLTNTSSGI